MNILFSNFNSDDFDVDLKLIEWLLGLGYIYNSRRWGVPYMAVEYSMICRLSKVSRYYKNEFLNPLYFSLSNALLWIILFSLRLMIVTRK